MIPLRDVNPTRRRPWATYAFIALNLAAFLLWQPRGGCPEAGPVAPSQQQACIEEIGFTFCRGAIPAELVDYRPLAADAPGGEGGFVESLRCPQKSVLSSLFTSMFLHAGLLHIGGNMLYLWIFGNNVEDRMGPALFIGFYLLGGVAATYAHVLTDTASQVPLIGASGAIAAVLGAYLVLYPRARVLTAVAFVFITLVELPAVVVLGFWFVLQAFQGVGSLGAGELGGVAWWAHVGGFAFGAAVALLFYRSRPQRQELIAPSGWRR